MMAVPSKQVREPSESEVPVADLLSKYFHSGVALNCEHIGDLAELGLKFLKDNDLSLPSEVVVYVATFELVLIKHLLDRKPEGNA